jgi:hypothetical protein
MNWKISWSVGVYIEKDIFGDIAGVSRVRARSNAPETEEELCGCKTHVTPLLESLSILFRQKVLGQELFLSYEGLLNVLKQPALCCHTQAEKRRA